MEDKYFYTIPELEKYFGISDTTLVRLIHQSHIKAFRLGRQWIVHKEEVERISGPLKDIKRVNTEENL